MGFLDEMKKNLNEVAPGLGDKTSGLVDKAKQFQQEAAQKVARNI